MRRLTTFIVAVLLAGGAVVGCGFGLADDTGRPIPGQYWPWVCADGGAPGDAGCPAGDAGVDTAVEGGASGDGAAGN